MAVTCQKSESEEIELAEKLGVRSPAHALSRQSALVVRFVRAGTVLCLLAMPACESRDPCLENVTEISAAASRPLALSCVEVVSFEGTLYLASCAQLDPTREGQPLAQGLSIQSAVDTYQFSAVRQVRGLQPDEALLFSTKPEFCRRGQRWVGVGRHLNHDDRDRVDALLRTDFR